MTPFLQFIRGGSRGRSSDFIRIVAISIGTLVLLAALPVGYYLYMTHQWSVTVDSGQAYGLTIGADYEQTLRAMQAAYGNVPLVEVVNFNHTPIVSRSGISVGKLLKSPDVLESSPYWCWLGLEVPIQSLTLHFKDGELLSSKLSCSA